MTPSDEEAVSERILEIGEDDLVREKNSCIFQLALLPSLHNLTGSGSDTRPSQGHSRGRGHSQKGRSSLAASEPHSRHGASVWTDDTPGTGSL